MRATVLEMMMFVGAAVLGEATVFFEASVIVGATVLEARVLIGATALKATVPMQIYRIIGATVLEATVLVGATGLGGRPRERVGSMD
jgi:hypothetical protein